MLPHHPMPNKRLGEGVVSAPQPDCRMEEASAKPACKRGNFSLSPEGEGRGEGSLVCKGRLVLCSVKLYVSKQQSTMQRLRETHPHSRIVSIHNTGVRGRLKLSPVEETFAKSLPP